MNSLHAKAIPLLSFIKKVTNYKKVTIVDVSNYKNLNSKIVCNCAKHGDFITKAYYIYSGRGCKKCHIENLNKNKFEKASSLFKERANLLHPTLDFTDSIYIGANKHISYTCKVHGKINSTPNNILNGHGCFKCRNLNISKLKNYTLDKFIELANIKHNNKYDYSKVNYINSKSKIVIVCKKHGEFRQTPFNHLQGFGCRLCANIKLSTAAILRGNLYEYSIWEKAGNKSKNFIGFSFYLIKCYNNSESFYKIGKTFTMLSKRFIGKRNMPYNYETIKLIKGNSMFISNLENKCKKLIINSYIPKIFFNGRSECFNDESSLKSILNTINQIE